MKCLARFGELRRTLSGMHTDTCLLIKHSDTSLCSTPAGKTLKTLPSIQEPKGIAPIPIPDVQTLRPSEQEWYPRLLVGHHYLNPSIPVYFFVRSTTNHSTPTQLYENLSTSFAVTPHGDPLRVKPDSVRFGSLLKHLVDQNPCLSPDLKAAMELAMPKIL